MSAGAPEITDARGVAVVHEAVVAWDRERERRGPGFRMREIRDALLARCALARRINDDEAWANRDVNEARATLGWRAEARSEFGEQQFAHKAFEHCKLAGDAKACAAGGE